LGETEAMMAVESPFAAVAAYPSASLREFRGARVPAALRTPAAEAEICRTGAALLDRTHRGLVRATGKDRASWLHNLITNAVKTLEPGQGDYAFACDVQGRIQFDLNVLVTPEALLLDIDRAALADALKHLDRHLITEDVKLADVSVEWARLGVVGPRALEIARGLGVENFAALPDLAHAALPDGAVLVRHPLLGPATPAFELIVPAADAEAHWRRLTEAGAALIGFETFEALRIEAGIPALGSDLDAKVLPAETAQLERAVNFHKGCYLGQEVIERMRSRGALARRLTKFEIAAEAEAAFALPEALLQEDKEVGRLTSAARHPESGAWIGLGYLRTGVSAAGGAIRMATTGREMTVRG
jgi:folate-binding protein YgfZ